MVFVTCELLYAKVNKFNPSLCEPPMALFTNMI